MWHLPRPPTRVPVVTHHTFCASPLTSAGRCSESSVSAKLCQCLVGPSGQRMPASPSTGVNFSSESNPTSEIFEGILLGISMPAPVAGKVRVSNKSYNMCTPMSTGRKSLVRHRAQQDDAITMEVRSSEHDGIVAVHLRSQDKQHCLLSPLGLTFSNGNSWEITPSF